MIALQHLLRPLTPQRARRPLKELLEGLVEATDAPEAGRQSDLGHGHARIVNELFREEDAARLRNGSS